MKYSQGPRSETCNGVWRRGYEGVIRGVRGYSPPKNFEVKTLVP